MVEEDENQNEFDPQEFNRIMNKQKENSDEVKGKPTWIWNDLTNIAIEKGYEYFKILGDDIRLPRDTGWLSCFINKLKNR